MRIFALAAAAALLAPLTACGYHTLGAATHLPATVRTLSVPAFQTRTETYHTEVLMTQAVIREFAARTRLRVTPSTSGDPDVTLHGTILQQQVLPLTFNTATQQSSSYVITIVASVTLNARDGRVLYQNNNYVFRQQFQATTDLATFLDESPAAEERLSRDFASALVADVLESL
ncbi:MAG TPA: LPS assembly lipoprotein LptE [Terracidiphilus sp.]|jgi:outer membrane lipopolysaccharide assembly protein LptE/RlpB|nr:LPS assembly lipoprotein LptE [Terracidiphilus sp.]